MRYLMIIIILAVLSLTNCLHLTGHYQSTDSISQLNGIEDMIMKSVNQIKENIQKNNENLIQVQTMDQKIAILQAYLLQQRKQILTIVKSSILDLNSTSYSCPSLNQNDKSALSQLNQFVSNFFIELSKSSTKIQNINTNEIIDIVPAISSNNLPIYSKNGQVDAKLGKLENSPNINIGYYVLGNATIQGLSIPSQQIDKYSEICPLDLPFVNSLGQCIACPPQKSYYQVDNLSCIECQTYNEITRKCSSVSYFTNFDAGSNQLLLGDSENIADYKLNKQNLPLCPTQAPFSNGNSCISCSNKLYFSLKDRNCQTCPTGKFYNIYNKKCQIQLYFSNLNNLQWETNSKQLDDILESITIKRSNESYTACPLDLPFSINQKCINCQKGSHFSYDSLSCVNCSNDTKLDLNMHKCLKPGNLNFQTNPLNTANLIFNGRSKNEWMNIYYQNLQKYSGIVDCPLEQPNFDGLACISCPHSHPYFNLELMVCQTCEGTTLYDQSQHQCISGSDNRPIQTPSWQKMAAVVFTK